MNPLLIKFAHLYLVLYVTFRSNRWYIRI